VIGIGPVALCDSCTSLNDWRTSMLQARNGHSTTVDGGYEYVQLWHGDPSEEDISGNGNTTTGFLDRITDFACTSRLRRQRATKAERSGRR